MENVHYIYSDIQRKLRTINYFSWQQTANWVAWLSQPNESRRRKWKENVPGELGETCVQSRAHTTARSQIIPSRLGPGRKSFHTRLWASPFTRTHTERWGNPGHRQENDTRPKQPKFNPLAYHLRRTLWNISPALMEPPGSSGPLPLQSGTLTAFSGTAVLCLRRDSCLSVPYCQLCHTLVFLTATQILAHRQHWINGCNLELKYSKAKCWHCVSILLEVQDK